MSELHTEANRCLETAQRMARCMALSAFPSTATMAMETLPSLPPLPSVIKGRAVAAVKIVYLYRMGKSPVPWCRYWEVEVETPIHLVETCSLLTPLRIESFEDYMPSLSGIINNRKLSLLFNFFTRLGILI